MAEFNVSINNIDKIGDLWKTDRMKPKVTQLLKMKRTKASQILKNVLAKTKKEILIQILRTQYFSLLVDESTDISVITKLVIIVQYWCKVTGKAKVQLFDIIDLDPRRASGEEIFTQVEALFNHHGIPFENCVGFSSDNAGKMIGCNSSFFIALLRRNPSIVSLPTFAILRH